MSSRDPSPAGCGVPRADEATGLLLKSFEVHPMVSSAAELSSPPWCSSGFPVGRSARHWVVGLLCGADGPRGLEGGSPALSQGLCQGLYPSLSLERGSRPASGTAPGSCGHCVPISGADLGWGVGKGGPGSALWLSSHSPGATPFASWESWLTHLAGG